MLALCWSDAAVAGCPLLARLLHVSSTNPLFPLHGGGLAARGSRRLGSIMRLLELLGKGRPRRGLAVKVLKVFARCRCLFNYPSKASVPQGFSGQSLLESSPEEQLFPGVSPGSAWMHCGARGGVFSGRAPWGPPNAHHGDIGVEAAPLPSLCWHLVVLRAPAALFFLLVLKPIATPRLLAGAHPSDPAWC